MQVKIHREKYCLQSISKSKCSWRDLSLWASGDCQATRHTPFPLAVPGAGRYSWKELLFASALHVARVSRLICIDFSSRQRYEGVSGVLGSGLFWVCLSLFWRVKCWERPASSCSVTSVWFCLRLISVVRHHGQCCHREVTSSSQTFFAPRGQCPSTGKVEVNEDWVSPGTVVPTSLQTTRASTDKILLCCYCGNVNAGLKVWESCRSEASGNVFGHMQWGLDCKI